MRPTSLSLIFLCVFLCFIGTASAATGFPEDFGFVSQDNYKEVVVKRVLKADRIELENGERFTLIGIRAPETPKKIAHDEESEDVKKTEYGMVIEKEVSPLTPLEEQAFDYVKFLLEGQTVRLEFDQQKKNGDLENLAYVFLIKDDLFVNADIVRQGYAHLQIRPPNTKYADELREAYREARQEKRGLQGEY